MAVAALGLAGVALWHDHAWQIVVGNLVFGAGVPMTFAAMATIIVETVRPQETGVASGMNTVMRTIGGVIGGQVGAAILTAQTVGNTRVPAESAFVTAFWVSAVVTAVAVVVALLITPRRSRIRAEPALERV